MNIEIEINANSTEYIKESLGAVINAVIKDSNMVEVLKIKVNFPERENVAKQIVKPPPRGIPSYIPTDKEKRRLIW